MLTWNTGKMRKAIERLRRSGVRIEDDWLRRMGPAHFGHINLGFSDFRCILVSLLLSFCCMTGTCIMLCDDFWGSCWQRRKLLSLLVFWN